MRLLETYIIFLKKDLMLADTCKSISDKLLTSITGGTFFAKELATYFEREDPSKPFKIDPATDPAQVAILKKLLNSLENTEKTLRAIEDFNISRDRYKIGILKDAIPLVYNAVHQIAATLQEINHSNSDIQTLLAPHINALMPKLALASQSLGQFTPDNIEASAGAMLGEAVKRLPSEKQTQSQSLETVSSQIYQLPYYFEELQKLITTATSNMTSTSVTGREEYQRAATEKAKDLHAEFTKLTTKQNGLTQLPNTVGIIRKLLAYSTDLVNSAAPLTTKAYLEAVEKLQDIKHNLLPQMLSELEQMEESLGLKSGVLTGDVIKQMESYYTQLATQVNTIAWSAGVLYSVSDSSALKDARFILKKRTAHDEASKLLAPMDKSERLTPIEDLTLMQDEVFVGKRREHQLNRLSEAQLAGGDETAKKAAERFFAKIRSCSGYIFKQDLSKLSQTDKDILIADYKQFQSHFASLHPAIDKLIVETLLHRSESGYLSRLCGAVIRQFGSDHFNQVLSCEKSVLANISQNTAQAKFKEKLVLNTMEHTLGTARKANNNQTLLSAGVDAFKPLIFSREGMQTSGQYHEKSIAVSKQLHELEQAQKGAKTFFRALMKYSASDSPLDEGQIEVLKRAYKKFQPQLIAMGYSELDQAIVEGLNNKGTLHSILTTTEITEVRSNLREQLAVYIKVAKEAQTSYVAEERQVKAEEVGSQPLLAQGSTLERKTLFGLLQEQQISKSVDKFFKGSFQSYLKDNLSATVWKELSADGKAIDMSKVPFLEFHKDSPEVRMYKQLINSVYYTQEGLKKLESLSDYGDPSYLPNRTRFMMTIYSALITNVNNSKYYFTHAAQNPGLKAVMQEGLDLLEPMKNLPIIGDYLRTPEGPELEKPKSDIMAIWRAQQEIVQASITPTIPVTQPEAVQLPRKGRKDEVVIPPEKVEEQSPAVDYVQMIGEKLFEIPALLQQLNTGEEASPVDNQKMQADIKNLVSELKGLSVNATILKQVLSVASKLQIQLSDIGASSRTLTLNKVQEIRSEFGTLLVEAADNAEFHLGMKPGTYSSVVSARFDKFYEALISHLPIKDEQTVLKLIVDATGTSKRLVREQERLQTVQADTTAQETRQAIYGSDYEAFHTNYKELALLKSVLTDIDEYPTQYGPSIDEMRGDAAAVYKKLQPSLSALDPKFDKDFIEDCVDEFALGQAIDTIFAASSRLLEAKGPFAKIQELLLLSDFTKDADKEQFLKEYEKLQPYLNKVHYSYDITYVLRELQTPEDFVTAARKIVDDAGKIEELIGGIDKAKQVKIELAKERISYCEQLLVKQTTEIGPQKIEDFKQQVFSDYLKANIESALAVTVGAPLAASFLQFSMPDFLAMKAEILRGITIKEDIATTIGSRLDQALAVVIAKNQAPFQEFLFNEHINKGIKGTIKDELGIYADLFINKIMPDYQKQKAQILSGLPFDEKLNTTIQSRLNDLNPELFSTHQELKSACTALNNCLKEINEQLEKEQLTADENPCRMQKLALLNSLKERINNFSRIPSEEAVAFLQQENRVIQIALKDIEHYDALINLHEIMDAIKDNILNSDATDKDEKMSDIAIIQQLLTDEKLLPIVRFNQAMRVISDQTSEQASRFAKDPFIAEAFKSQVFINYINKQIKEQIRPDLGGYTTFFMKQITPDFMAKKDEIIKDIPVIKINEQLVEKFNQLTPDVLQKHSELKSTLQQLNSTLKQINRILHDEVLQPDNNPCRQEKIRELQSIQKLLQDADTIPERDPIATLQSRQQQATTVLSKLHSYDTLIHIHDTLETMSTHVHKSTEKSKIIKDEKLQEIQLMQKMITSSEAPEARLSAIKKHGLSEDCQKTLHKNSDNVFQWLIKKLVSWISGPTEEEKLSVSFKERLHQIKESAVPKVELEELNELDEHAEPGAPDESESSHYVMTH